MKAEHGEERQLGVLARALGDRASVLITSQVAPSSA